MPDQNIDLAQPRTLALTDRGHVYTFTVNPIPKKAWLQYFSGIESTSETIEGKVVNSFDSTGARLILASSVLSNATGYKFFGHDLITGVAGWQDLLPSAHRLAVSNMLTSVDRSSATEDEPITLGVEAVRLNALWSWNSGDASMNLVSGLTHIFSVPTVEQQRRYNRDMSRSQVVGGSRTGKTRWLGAQATLAQLYDELIQDVEGYRVGDQPLHDRDRIVEKMDTYHKVVATEALLTPAATAIAEEKES